MFSPIVLEVRHELAEKKKNNTSRYKCRNYRSPEIGRPRGKGGSVWLPGAVILLGVVIVDGEFALR